MVPCRKGGHANADRRKVRLWNRTKDGEPCARKGASTVVCPAKAGVFSRRQTYQGKSHPLEGSCQEAILLPHTTFDVFSVAFRSAHSTPAYARRRIRVFIPAVSALMRRTSHPSGSRPRDVSQSRQTSAPGIVDAPENPRCPTVSNCVQRTDPLAPSRVHFFQGSRQRRRTTQSCGGRPYDGG